MGKLYFKYQRSTRIQAMKMLFIAIGFPISFWLMINAFANGKLSDEQEIMIYGGILAVSFLLVVVFVIPDFFRKTKFTYEVTDQFVKCSCPAGESYQLKLSDIVRLLQIKRATGQLWIDELIETRDGKVYSIPKKYDLDIYKVIKAIRAANPDIIRENKVRY